MDSAKAAFADDVINGKRRFVDLLDIGERHIQSNAVDGNGPGGGLYFITK